MNRFLATTALLVGAVMSCEPAQIPLPDGATRGAPIVYDPPPMARISLDSWESSPWPGAGVEWLAFPRNIDVTLRHNLGRTPAAVNVYLAFEKSGASGAPAAGDLARIQQVTDRDVTLRNGTQQDYWLRVVLR